MAEEVKVNKLSISVRRIVEFILNSGDLDNRAGFRDPDAMQEGIRLHKKIQKEQGSEYKAEVPLCHESSVVRDDEPLLILVDGRADGIFQGTREARIDMPESYEQPFCTIIDEIKTTYRDVKRFKEPESIHRAQAMCYAYMYAYDEGLDYIGIQLTYCNIETEQIVRFREDFSFGTLHEWYEALVYEYAKWAAWQIKWARTRNASLKTLEFPFPYRPGQRDLVAGVYRTIQRNKRLYIEAPTGVGKTMSTVFPTVRAMGEGLTSKIFYTTAKTIARTVAEEAFSILVNKGAKLKFVTITAKEKICILDKPDCNPDACPRAKGHFDRVNDAVFDLLTSEERIDRTLIEKYAEKHNVCPFEMGLDVSTWADAIIGDYNYVFDPTVKLKRFFADAIKHDYVFLSDEAHNLVERGREMYSAELIKEEFLEVKRLVGKETRDQERIGQLLNACNKAMLALKQQCEDFEVWEDVSGLTYNLMRFANAYEGLPRDFTCPEKDRLTTLYFDVRNFLAVDENLDDNYRIFTDYLEDGRFRVKLQCMDPSDNIHECLECGRAAVFFSATLLPVRYYMDQLAGRDDDYAIYAPSPFDEKKRLLMVAQDVSTKYTRRSASEYEKIAKYIIDFTSAKTGNYMVFFPSYKMLEEIAELCEGRLSGIVLQQQSMNEEEREQFLLDFTESPESSRIGFCVMGGIFSEGIDLTNDRLIGAVIVGTGLPQVCNERELFRGYYDDRNNMGFDYAYLYNGMNKVLQSAGRVIRTVEDRGGILLLDDRFLKRQYMDLFPREWSSYVKVSVDNVGRITERFWKEQDEEK